MTAPEVAVSRLRQIECSDPAAAPALRAVRLAIHTLERWWLEPTVRSSQGGWSVDAGGVDTR
jgi:hypothetical protein